MQYMVKNTRLRRGGKVIAPGGTVEIPEKEAGPLVKRGLLEKVQAETGGKKPRAGKGKNAEGGDGKEE